MQLAGKGHRFFGVTHIRFGDDLDQRCAGAVEVDAGHAVPVYLKRAFMQGFSCVFFQMGVVNADGFLAAVRQFDVHVATTDDGLFQLGGLIGLGQIRVEIVFALEHRGAGDVGIDGQTEHDGIAKCLFIGHRQGAGHGEVDGAGLSVGLGAKGGAGAGKDFRLGGQLHVDFEADDGFPLHYSRPSGVRWCQSVARWNWWAAFNIRPSSK